MSADDNARSLVKSFDWFTGEPSLSKLEAEIMNLTTVRRATNELLEAKWAELCDQLNKSEES